VRDDARLRPARLLTVALIALAAAPAQAADQPSEPFFPRAGNRGYDALHYNAVVSYRSSGRIHVAEQVRLRTTQRLQTFSFDLYGLRVRSVFVDGKAARFSRGHGKLKIVAPRPIGAGHNVLVKLRYRGRPQLLTDPDGSREGWFRSDDGALAVGEPLGTATWLACNNVPRDKAGFGISIGVPRPLVGVSNGRLIVVESEHGRRRFHWKESQPMSPYLAVVDIGRGKLRKSAIDGHPAWTLVDPRLQQRVRKPLRRLPEIIRFESKLLGPYPFDAAGSIVDEVPAVGYALETQTRPIYPYATDLTTVVHETAHQWFGDSVGLKRWPNIWLNEGFATWTEWYYAERHGGLSAHAVFYRLYRVPASNHGFWEPPSGHPGSPRNLFATSTYVRGAMALEALRLQIGTKSMLRLLRTWVGEHRYGSGDIEEFISLAEKISGRNLDSFFQRWLYNRDKP
jgi:aminopeptidase N